MNTNEIDERLENLLKETFQIERINLESSMDDIPEWDSFKHIELIIAIEEKFKIQLEYTDTTEMVSIPIIKSKILKLMNNE
jgi:acyl carrier protein